MRERLIHMIMIVVALLCIVVFMWWQTYGLRLTKYTYSDSRLPRSFKGYKIVHISDFHNTRLLTDQVASFTADEQPDIIAITGDLVDCRLTDFNVGLELIDQLVKIAPVYYVRGNHEARIDETEEQTEIIRSKGVNIIEDSKLKLWRGNQYITLIGLKDPRFAEVNKDDDKDTDEEDSLGKKLMDKALNNLTKEDDSFKLLLSHRPELAEMYQQYGINLALTGHAHGGQFGIPFTDYGVFVPNQGFFPAYAAGMKTFGDTTVIISRGIGNSAFPFRLFNRPEVVVVEFQ